MNFCCIFKRLALLLAVFSYSVAKQTALRCFLQSFIGASSQLHRSTRLQPLPAAIRIFNEAAEEKRLAKIKNDKILKRMQDGKKRTEVLENIKRPILEVHEVGFILKTLNFMQVTRENLTDAQTAGIIKHLKRIEVYSQHQISNILFCMGQMGIKVEELTQISIYNLLKAARMALRSRKLTDKSAWGIVTGMNMMKFNSTHFDEEMIIGLQCAVSRHLSLVSKPYVYVVMQWLGQMGVAWSSLMNATKTLILKKFYKILRDSTPDSLQQALFHMSLMKVNHRDFLYQIEQRILNSTEVHTSMFPNMTTPFFSSLAQLEFPWSRFSSALKTKFEENFINMIKSPDDNRYAVSYLSKMKLSIFDLSRTSQIFLMNDLPKFIKEDNFALCLIGLKDIKMTWAMFKPDNQKILLTGLLSMLTGGADECYVAEGLFGLAPDYSKLPEELKSCIMNFIIQLTKSEKRVIIPSLIIMKQMNLKYSLFTDKVKEAIQTLLIELVKYDDHLFAGVIDCLQTLEMVPDDLSEGLLFLSPSLKDKLL